MTSAARSSARLLLIGGIAVSFGSDAAAQTAPTPAQTARYWKPVEDALGRKGTPNPGGVLKFSFPRSDLRVVLNGVILKPALALGTWVAFKRIGDHVMVMGDLVLLDSEVAEVLGSLQQNGIEQTALHNHLVRESPHVMYMHIRAIGNPVRIAKAVRTALEFTQTPLAPAPTTPAAATAAPAALDLDTAAIAKVMGVRGKVNGGIYQLTFPRREKIRQEKMDIPPAMGIATAINFQSTGAGKAAVTGDFVLLGREVNPVIWALGENGIEVTAIHSHMIGEEPRLFFMHFWANDDAQKLAKGLRAALDKVDIKKS